MYRYKLQTSYFCLILMLMQIQIQYFESKITFKILNIFKIITCVSLCRYRTQISDVLTGFGCIPGRWSAVPDAICMRAGPRDEKYVEISHSPPGWHVMCNKTEFMFPQNLNTFLPGTVPRGSGLGRNLNKKRSATLATVHTAAALGNTESASFDVIVLPCAEL